MCADKHDIKVGDYLVVLEKARAALNAVEKKCLRDYDNSHTLTDDDWASIRSTYGEVIGHDRWRPPMHQSTPC